MTQFSRFLPMTLGAVAIIALSTISSVYAHGYLSKPSPRGIEKLATQIDALRNPNNNGICRGEPAGQVHSIGHSVILEFEISVRHVGACEVYILDENLDNARRVDSRDKCFAEEEAQSWSITIPSDITGRHVIRWVWNAAHLVTEVEQYEQCVDVNISSDNSPDEDDNGTDNNAFDNSISNNNAIMKSDVDLTPEEEKLFQPMRTFPIGRPIGTSVIDTAPGVPHTFGECKIGELRCYGDSFGQCVNGAFSWSKCPVETTCRGNGNTLYCDRRSDFDNGAKNKIPFIKG